MNDPFDETAGKASAERLRLAAEDIRRVLPVLPARIRAMVDAMQGWPTGRGFDTVRGRSGVSFCEAHGQERCACGGGTTGGTATDPTGLAALATDRARADHDRVVALSKSIRRDADALATVLARWTPRAATEKERQATTPTSERDVPCWSCSRISKWEPAVRSAEVAGQRRELCWWCFDWVRKGDGSAPSREQVDQHHRGQRVRRPA